MKSSHEFVDHTSEMGLRVRASSYAEVLAEAARGLAELQLRGKPAQSEGDWRRLEVESTDREALLVDWLNELIFRAETEHWIAVDVEVHVAGDTGATARGRGVVAVEAPSFVKAATHHRLSVRQIAGGVEAEVVLDI